MSVRITCLCCLQHHCRTGFDTTTEVDAGVDYEDGTMLFLPRQGQSRFSCCPTQDFGFGGLFYLRMDCRTHCARHPTLSTYIMVVWLYV